MKIKQTKEGWWIADGDTHLSKWVEESGQLDHDTFLPQLAREFIPEGGIVIDCGANIGSHTVTYSNQVGENGKVFAIEPGTMAFHCLEQNIRKFKHPNAFIVWVGLSDKEGKSLHVESSNLGGSICVENAAGTTPMDTLDSFAFGRNLSKVDFIKIDCEGWERKILEGGSGLIQKFLPAMLIEMNFYALQAQNSSYGEIFELLARWGYKWEVAQPECNPNSPQWDLIAWHPTKTTYDHQNFLDKDRQRHRQRNQV